MKLTSENKLIINNHFVWTLSKALIGERYLIAKREFKFIESDNEWNMSTCVEYIADSNGDLFFKSRSKALLLFNLKYANYDIFELKNSTIENGFKKLNVNIFDEFSTATTRKFIK